MSIEKTLQTKIIKYLKSHNCVVIKLSAVPGVPTGIPDILFLIDGGRWGFLEVKASPTAKFQPLQKRWVDELNKMSYAAVVYPENWLDIQIELLEML